MINIKYDNYRKALVEVEAALKCLNNDDYKKIPQELIKSIEDNKDKNYIYEYDENLDYKYWNFMNESKAVLYNIFKDYLATEE